MIAALAVIFSCQLAGEALARLTGLPVPGPVIGMLLLLTLLLVRDRLAPLSRLLPPDGPVEQVSGVMLAHLSLLFVPAGVGVIQRLDVLGQHWFALAVALVGSSLAGIVATAAVFRWVDRRCGRS